MMNDEDFKASMEAAIANNRDLSAVAVAAMRKVMAERESILEAFIAKHGFEPDECVQVEFRTKDNGFGWCVRKRESGEP